MTPHRKSPSPVAPAALLTAFLLVPGSSTAQRQFAELAGRGLPAVFDSTQAVALGDVDGDADLDIVFGNTGRNRLCLNDGHGIYAEAGPASMPADGDDTRAVALADVDGDGDLDIVLGNSGQNRLYLNDGTGAYRDATAAQMPADGDWTQALALGDVDLDGDLDIVLGNGGQNRLYRNDGAGRFTDATASRMPSDADMTSAVALADVDGDGDPDLVCGNWQQQNRLYLNDGTGTFTDATGQRMPTDIAATTALALGDVDLDGDLDIVTGSRAISTVFCSATSEIYRNDGTGTFVHAGSVQLGSGVESIALALGDVDGDGDEDIVLGNAKSPFVWCSGGPRNRLYLNDGTGAYAEAPPARMPGAEDDTTAVALGDVDGDGDLDIVFGNGDYGGQRNRVHLNDGAAAFSDTCSDRLPVDRDETHAAAFGDVDGDGDLDIVLANDGRSRLYLNDGTAGFTDATAAHMPAAVDRSAALAVGDVDGDGDPDIVFGNAGQDWLFLNDGAGRFTDATTTRMPIDFDRAAAVALADVDGDSDLDIVIGNGGQNRLYLNDGAGTFTDATAARMPAYRDATFALAVGDVDGDGDLDVVCGSAQQQNRLYLNDGKGTFADATVSRLPPEAWFTSSVALGDVDGDGDLDLLIGNVRGEQNRLLLNDGTGAYTDATAGRLPIDGDHTVEVRFGDLDLDGDLDIVCANGAQNRLYLNDGTGRYADATGARLPADVANSQALALGDVDSDGDLDVVFGNLALQNRLYLNLCRQIDTPWLPRVGRPFAVDAYARSAPSGASDVVYLFAGDRRTRVLLPPYGVLGIDPARLVPLATLAVPGASGFATVTVPVPASTALAGGAVLVQGVLVRSATAAWLTNLTADVILSL